MSLSSYEFTRYSMPWRANYEFHQSMLFFSGAIGYEAFAYWGSFTPAPLHWGAGMLSVLGLMKLVPAIKLYRRQLRLAGSPCPEITFSAMKKEIERGHSNDLWLGVGFSWGQPQAQAIYDLLKRDWFKLTNEALGSIRAIRFVKEYALDCLLHPIQMLSLYKEKETSIDRKGQSWIHGLNETEEKIFQPIEHTEGHTLIIGTTGAGKTRTFDLLISQAILRGETVFIIDPKGDYDLADKAKRACEALGRADAFVYFHPAKPEISCKFNPLANWVRTTEAASRVADLMPGLGGTSDPFTAFAWRALNSIAQAMIYVNQKPSIQNLRHNIENGAEELVETTLKEAIHRYFAQKGQESAAQIAINQALSLLKVDIADKRIQALIGVYERTERAPEVDGILSVIRHEKEHFGKMITSLLPILSMLTSGSLGKLLSPSDDLEESMEEDFRDSEELIKKNSVVYMALDTLSDSTVGAALGSLILADLTSTAGCRYNYMNTTKVGGKLGELTDQKVQTVNVFVDEAAEVASESLVQLLNKGRGAKFKLWIATQTVADFSARLGSKDRGMKVLANLNNIIALRSFDKETRDYVATRFPKTKIKQIAVDQASGVDALSMGSADGRYGEKLSEVEVPLFPSECFGMLPDLEFMANISGGYIFKGKLPLLFVKDK